MSRGPGPATKFASMYPVLVGAAFRSAVLSAEGSAVRAFSFRRREPRRASTPAARGALLAQKAA